MTAVLEPRQGKLTKWRPRKWEAMHEQIVVLSCLGRSNKQIAEIFGYTPQHICNILGTPEASLVRRRVLDNLRDSVKSNLDQSLEDLADQSVIRLKEVMFDDDLFEKSPFAVVDRGLAVLRGVGRLKSGDDNSTKVGKAIIMSSEDAKKLIEGTAAADEAKRLNPPRKEEVVDAAD